MGIRRTVSGALDRVAGTERTTQVRRLERRVRSRLIDVLDVEGSRPRRPAKAAAKKAPAKKAAAKKAAAKKAASPKLTRAQLIEAHGAQSREGISHAAAGSLPWASADPSATFPKPQGTRHTFLSGLHEVLAPRTYLEIGVSRGESLKLSRTRSIGVDPQFTITAPIQCDVRIFRETSDDFFLMPEAFAHFAGVPVDLGFIDGMHLAEFALRDFMNLEKHMSPAGAIVIDDMLPRNSLEAFRIRRTSGWTGDVFKVHEVLTTYRPDLTIIPVNTHPTGSYLVVGLDPESTVLDEHYAEIEKRITAPDPQVVPQEWLERRTAVEPDALLGSDVWKRIVEAREGDPTRAGLAPLWEELRTAAPVAPRP